MAQDISDAGHFAQRDPGMPGFDLSREVTAGLRDDVDAPLNGPLALPVGLELFKRDISDDVNNTVDGTDQVAET